MNKRNTTKTRKTWVKHFGPIPVDTDGRKCEIHHIDGDPNNDDIANLICLTIHEHYEIHFWQGDWGACSAIGVRLRMSVEEISTLATLHNTKMLDDGTHPFSKRADGSSIGAEVSRKMVEDGTHNFIGSPYAKKMYEDGTHPFLGGDVQRKTNDRRIQDGTHNLLGVNNPSHVRVKNGTHHMVGPKSNLSYLERGIHVSQLKVSCIYCHRELDKANFSRSHGGKCKHKP